MSTFEVGLLIWLGGLSIALILLALFIIGAKQAIERLQTRLSDLSENQRGIDNQHYIKGRDTGRRLDAFAHELGYQWKSESCDKWVKEDK